MGAPHYLGIQDADPIGEPRSAEELAEYEGTFATVSTIDAIRVNDDHLLLESTSTPEVIAQLGEDVDVHEDPIPLWMLAGPGDRFVVHSGPYAGARGYFIRDESGRVIGIHDHGRFAPRR